MFSLLLLRFLSRFSALCRAPRTWPSASEYSSRWCDEGTSEMCPIEHSVVFINTQTHLLQLRFQHRVGWDPILAVPLVLGGPGVQMSTRFLLVGRTTSSCSVGKMPKFVFLLNFTEALGQTGVPCSLGSKHANVLRVAVCGLRLDKMRWLTSCSSEEALALIALLLWCSANRRNSQHSRDVRTKKRGSSDSWGVWGLRKGSRWSFVPFQEPICLICV